MRAIGIIIKCMARESEFHKMELAMKVIMNLELDVVMEF